MGIRLTNEPYFEKKEHTYYCGITDDKGNVFLGIAQCHPEDQDLESEKVGYTIASHRALIRALKHYRKNEIRPTLNAFEHLYNSMRQSKYFDYKSYEAKRVYKTIKNYKADLEEFSTMIKEAEDTLKQYLSDKEEFRKKIRAIRAKDEN